MTGLAGGTYAPAEVKSLETREKEVESYLTTRLEEIGLPVYKFVPDQAPGMPDREILLPHREVLWVETKRPKGGRLSDLQKYRHAMLTRAGHDVVTVWTKAEADALVARLQERLQAERT